MVDLALFEASAPRPVEMLRLQRTAGNGAVAFLLAGAGHGDGPVTRPPPFVQRGPEIPKLIPKFSQSTEDEIAIVMREHPGLTRANAERLLQGPPGAVPKASGEGGKLATATGGATPGEKTPDVEFRQITTRGSSGVLRGEVKVVVGGQGKFNDRLGEGVEQLKAGGGGELLVQVPEGTNARSRVDRLKGSVLEDPKALQKFGRYRSVRITIVEPSGKVLLSEPLEFMSKVPPASGGIPPSGGAVPPSGGSIPLAVKPAAPEVPVPQSKVETPPVGGAGTGATLTRLGVGASRLRTAGRFLAAEAPGLLFQALLMAIFPPEMHIHNENYGALRRQKIDPALHGALAEQAATFNKLAADDPAQSIWATVTVESEYRGEGTSKANLEVYLQDLRFIEMKLTHEYLLAEGPQFQALGAGAKASKKVTYSIPISGPATRGSEEAIRNFRTVRGGITNSAYRVRLAAMLAMYNIAKADSFLKNQLVSDLQSMLNDDESKVREAATHLLSRL